MTMKTLIVVLVLGTLFFSVNSVVAVDNAKRLGAGIHYWKVLDEIDVTNVDEDGVAFIVSYQHQLATLSWIEVDLEFFDEGYAGADTLVLKPQVYFLLGNKVYAGVGMGIDYANELASKPFYALKAGFEIGILPLIVLDINGNYRFENWDFDRIENDVDTNTVTLAAIARLEF